MKEKVNITDYANIITKTLPKGILLNTYADKFNSMVISWGHLGTLWNKSTFHGYTKEQLDKAGEFSISIPLDSPDPQINKILGWQSGFHIDKVKEAGLLLEDAEMIKTPGVKQYPLTIECKVLFYREHNPNLYFSTVCLF